MKSKSLTLLGLFLVAISWSACSKNKATSSPATAENTMPATVDVSSEENVTPDTASENVQATKVKTNMSGDVKVLESAVCKSVENLTPLEPGTNFSSDIGRVYFYTKLGTQQSEETYVTHVWNYQNKEIASVKLAVEGQQWRTYSSKHIPSSFAGEWRVDVVTQDNTVIDSASFTIE